MKDCSEPGGSKHDPSTGPGVVARGLLMWSYARGTLQYDILCALILAFIFFVPRSCFAPKPDGRAGQGSLQQTTSPGSTVAPGR